MNHLTTPALPPPERCVDVMAALRQGADGENYKIADRLELHMPRDAPFVRGTMCVCVWWWFSGVYITHKLYRVRLSLSLSQFTHTQHPHTKPPQRCSAPKAPRGSAPRSLA